MDFETVKKPSSLGRFERFIERSACMSIQIVHNQYNLFCFRIMIVKQVFDLMRPVYFGSTVRYCDLSAAGQWFKKHEDVRYTISFIFLIVPGDSAWFCWHGLSCFFRQLLAGFIHTDQRTPRVECTGVEYENVFHRADKSGVCMRRDTPLILHPWLEFVFFNVFRIASWEILSTYPSSTILSARSRNVHLARPGGGSLKDNAIRCAESGSVDFFAQAFLHVRTPLENSFKSFFNQLLADALDGLYCHIKRYAYHLVRPCGTCI